MTESLLGQLVQSVRRTTLSRGGLRLWHSWKDAGLPLLAAYWLAVSVIFVYGLWDAYRLPALTLPSWVLASVIVLLWFISTLVRKLPIWTHTLDDLLLQTPLPTVQTLVWPVMRALLTPMAWGSGLGLLMALLLPQLIWSAVALPLALMGAIMLQASSMSARLSGNQRLLTFTKLLAFLPFLAAPFMPLLPLVTGAGLLGAILVWTSLWQTTVHPRPRLHLQFEGIRRGARQLGLPAPTQHPDIPPPHSRFRPTFHHSGAFAVCTWRSLLHVMAHPWRLWTVLALGPALFPILSGVAIDITGGPVLSGILLSFSLPLLGPSTPPGLPITAASERLARILPAALPLSILAALSGVLMAIFVHVSPLIVPIAALAPWVVLANTEWMETSGFMLADQAVQARIGLAMLPGVITFLFVYFGLAWAAPVALLATAVIPLGRGLLPLR